VALRGESGRERKGDGERWKGRQNDERSECEERRHGLPPTLIKSPSVMISFVAK